MRRFLLACLGVVLLGAADIRPSQDSQDPPPKDDGVRLPRPAPGQFAPGQPAPFGGQPGVPFGAPPMAPHKEIVPVMVEALRDADADVRKYAAATLIAIGRDAVPALLDAFKDKDSEVRANAAYVLGQMGPAAQEAVPVLLKAMKDDDTTIRRRVAFALHRLVRSSHDGMSMPGMPGMMGGGMAPRPDYRPATLTVPDPGLVLPSEVAVPFQGKQAGPAGAFKKSKDPNDK